MLGKAGGSWRMFRVAGIDVSLHWSWLIVAAIQIDRRSDVYPSLAWNVAEYLGLFAIVLLHEFGHSLACRSVGGKADRIVLWPLGGVAFVNPPPRPGAVLWSIAAGPLVNVLIAPVLWVLAYGMGAGFGPDMQHFLRMMFFINAVILVFNLLPIYPLDGGQILRSLLWFVIGRSRSLFVACVLGIAGAAGLGALALWQWSIWIGILAGFMMMQSVAGFRQARALGRFDALPRRKEAKCPACGAAPLHGLFWRCEHCGGVFDTFETGGRCPSCGIRHDDMTCPECQQRHPLPAWGAR